MAIATGDGKGGSGNEGSGQGQSVERAFVAANGTIVCPHCEAKLISVDVADVDLLMSFSDGTYVIIPNGALDAIANPLQPIVFTDPDDSVLDSAHFDSDHTSTLGDLFKMVGVTKVAGAGSLRVVSENIDARGKGDGGDDPEGRENEVVDSGDAPLSDEIIPPPVVEASSGSILTGKGPGTGAIDPIDKLSVDPEEPVPPSTTPRPSVYKAAQKVEDISDPTITLDPNIADDGIINIDERDGIEGDISISGRVGGGAQIDDTVTLNVIDPASGQILHTYTTTVDSDKTFSFGVPGAELADVGDGKTGKVAVAITTKGAVNPGTDEQSYGVDLTAPVPEIYLDPITADNIIKSDETDGSVTISGSVGGDARVGDIVTLDINDGALSYTTEVVSGKTFSISVNGSDLELTAGGHGSIGTVDASITVFDNAGNEGGKSVHGEYEVDTMTPSPTIIFDPDVAVADDGVLSLDEAKGTVAVKGTVGGDAGAGDTIILTVDGKEYIGSVDPDGLSFSIEVSGSDLVSDSDKKIEARIETDWSGNIGAGENSVEYTLDDAVEAPTIILDLPMAGDNIINGHEEGGYVAITGTVDGGALPDDKIILTVNDPSDGSILHTATGLVQDDMTFNINVDGSILTAVGEGTENGAISVEIIGGWPGTTGPTTADTTYSVDTKSPTSPIVDLADDTGSSNSDKITSDGTLALSGIETDATVEYSIDGGATWSDTFTPIEGSNTVAFRQTDTAGNTSGIDSLSFTLDTSNPTVESGQSFSYAENQTLGTVVATVAAS
ncbi:MAG: Ig-like domain-containing protein, partial [Desulfurivibrionaceae bacterium]